MNIFFLLMVENHSFGVALTTPSKRKYWPAVSFALKIFSLPRKIVSLDTKSPTLPIPHVSWKKTRYKDLHNSECIYYSTQVGSSYLHENTLPFLWEWALHPSVFVKPQHRYGQIMTIKMAPQNELSSYFFQIITQENYPRKSIIFDVPLQTHVSLCQNHRFKVINQNRLILSFPLQMKFKNFYWLPVWDYSKYDLGRLWT